MDDADNVEGVPAINKQQLLRAAMQSGKVEVIGVLREVPRIVVDVTDESAMWFYAARNGIEYCKQFAECGCPMRDFPSILAWIATDVESLIEIY